MEYEFHCMEEHVCCMAMTLECLSCSEGMTEEEFCEEYPEHEVCPRECELTGGEIVAHGWYGADTGSNYCNQCGCHDGVLACTMMFCIEEEEVDCDDCVERFARQGGCECWMDEGCDEGALVPLGCDICAEQASEYCDIPMGDYECDGSMGTHDCVCPEGLMKTAFHVAPEPMTSEFPVVYGRRKMAVYGEDMYCEDEMACLVEEEQEDGLAGPIGMFWDCLHLETWEYADVVTYYPVHGDEMPEDASKNYCMEYEFHCMEEEPQVCCR